MRLLRIWRWFWPLPVTLVGAAVVLLVRALGGRVAIVDGVIEAGGGEIGCWMQRCTRIDAITLGHVVVASSAAALDRWRAHEQAHVRQYERWGTLMPLLYLASSLREGLRGRGAYRRNVFERQARIAAWRERRSGLDPQGLRSVGAWPRSKGQDA